MAAAPNGGADEIVPADTQRPARGALSARPDEKRCPYLDGGPDHHRRRDVEEQPHVVDRSGRRTLGRLRRRSDA